MSYETVNEHRYSVPPSAAKEGDDEAQQRSQQRGAALSLPLLLLVGSAITALVTGAMFWHQTSHDATAATAASVALRAMKNTQESFVSSYSYSLSTWEISREEQHAEPTQQDGLWQRRQHNRQHGRQLGVCDGIFGGGNPTPPPPPPPPPDNCDENDPQVVQLCTYVQQDNYICTGCGKQYVTFYKQCDRYCIPNVDYCVAVNASLRHEYEPENQRFGGGTGDLYVVGSANSDPNANRHVYRQHTVCNYGATNCTNTIYLDGQECIPYNTSTFYCTGDGRPPTTYRFDMTLTPSSPLYWSQTTAASYFASCLGFLAGGGSGGNPPPGSSNTESSSNMDGMPALAIFGDPFAGLLLANPNNP